MASGGKDWPPGRFSGGRIQGREFDCERLGERMPGPLDLYSIKLEFFDTWMILNRCLSISMRYHG